MDSSLQENDHEMQTTRAVENAFLSVLVTRAGGRVEISRSEIIDLQGFTITLSQSLQSDSYILEVRK